MSSMGTLLKSCGRGNQDACTIARKINALYAGSMVSFSDVATKGKHPNKLPFSGTLLVLDEPSQKPPHGSQGHRILVHKNVAKNKLQGIIGMAVNYSSDLTEHATSHKVGIITKAWIEGNEVKVSGFIWLKDFPEAERLKGRHDLGMSMELADVYVEDEDASVWNLEDFDFTGATILKKDAAAYTKTSLAAANATRGEGATMPKLKEKTKVAAARRDTGQDTTALAIQAMTGNITAALHKTFSPMVNDIKASNQALREDLAEVSGRLRLVEVHAAAQEEDDDEIVLNAGGEDESDESDEMAAAKEDASDESDEMAAAKEDESDESDEMAAAKADESDDESDDDSSSTEMDAMEDLEQDPADEEPGEVNKDAKNKGRKTSVTKPPNQGAKFKGNVAEGRLNSAGKKGKGMKPFGGMDAAAVKIESLYASNRKLKRTLFAMQEQTKKDTKKLRTQIKAMSTQLEHFTVLEGRRSHMPSELTHLASKSGVNLAEIKASGQKLSVQDADLMFANAKNLGINIGPSDRIAMKNLMIEQGILDEGVIDRGYGRQ